MDTTSGVTKDYAHVVDELADIEGDADVMTSDDDLRSIDSDSDEEGRGNRVKHTVFNEKTDMENPIFKVGMEFKTHAVFREAVKEHAIKWGKEIKFLKSDKRQKYSEKIRKNPTWPIPFLVDTIESEKTVKVHPQKAYRAKKIALDMLQGNAAKQFTMLNSYAKEILNTNDGTTIIIKVKPVVGSEAYAVVEKEKRKTSLWLLELLGEDLKIENSFRFTFMSYKQKGLIDFVSTLFPNASHRFCVRHLYNNFKGEFKGLVMKDILWKVARAIIMPHFTATWRK
ncbi:hypothetical protein Vadar_032154 [Vaccinium darrowii]|uniref:Uncharacterized protein n=1 Tax=Vaccinium darrowii TaxID=229202 RepID=A0ACB7X5N3_9ERIC|nr:hypothetical protein Vadar_032154 [Vaccinium darrowii]